MKQGLSEPEARRAALLELGGVEQVKEQVREIRMGHFLDERLQEFRFACRALRKAPVFSATVALVLALGLGSTALIFTLVNSVVLKGPPFPQADRLFRLWQDLPQEPQVSFSPREFDTWSKQTAVFESLAGFTGNGFTITGLGEPVLIIGQQVTTSFFPTLGTTPALGRVFLEEESKAGHDRAVILSHALWRDKFNQRRDVLGEALMMNGEPYTIVGVMPETFGFPRHDVRLWVPAALDGPLFQEQLDAHLLRVLGRLKPGITAERLGAELDLLGTRVNAPGDDTVRRFQALNLREFMSQELRRPLLILLGAVAFLLLIACANVANLMLARASARQQEMAIRTALGASRGKLIAQWLTEAALLSFVGGALGIALAAWGLDLLRAFAAENLPELLNARLDGSTLAFVIAAAIASALFFGLGPALAASRTKATDALKGATRSSASAGAERTRQALVFTEVALACVLLIGCALMLRSFVALIHTSPGFRSANVINADTSLSEERYPESGAMIRFYREALRQIETLPGVESAGAITHLPFGGNSWGNGYEVEGRPAPTSVTYTAQIRPASPGYFSTLSLPLKKGRAFTAQDNESAPGVAIVNEVLAQRFWPHESPLGRRLRYGGDWLEIIGVCGNLKHAQLDGEPDAEIYVPYPQVPAGALTFVGRNLYFVVRSAQPAAIAPQVRGLLQTLDPAMVVKINTMDALISESVAQPRFRTWLIAIVSAFALILACLGIYGLIAYLVTQRYREIGIRLALGATRTDILRLVLGRTLKLTGAGVAAGLLIAFFLTRFLNSLLFGVATHDLATFIAVPVALIGIAVLAGYLPARRATRINPVTSLRYE